MQKLLIMIFILWKGVAMAEAGKTEVAIFAMGCFWCGESEFRDPQTHQPLKGILSLKVGYAGGTKPNPTYQSHEGYKEALKIEFDPKVITYDQLLKIFWRNVDFFDGQGQFCDKGYAYTSAVFYSDEGQKAKAEAEKTKLAGRFGRPLATELFQATTFYDAEDYHQNYKEKNPVRYKYYRWNCGRDQRLKALWEEK